MGVAVNLNQVTLPATDLGRSVAFYERIGLTLIVDSLPRYARLECPDGGATLSLHRAQQCTPDSGVTIYFECNDLDVLVEALSAAGVVFEHGPIDQAWLWREARLRDPDGNMLCLFSAGDKRRFPPWRINREPRG